MQPTAHRADEVYKRGVGLAIPRWCVDLDTNRLVPDLCKIHAHLEGPRLSMENLRLIKGQNRPVMVATLEPGLAWIEMATVDGGINRRQPGNPPPPASSAAGGGVCPLAFPLLPGAIWLVFWWSPRSGLESFPAQLGPLITIMDMGRHGLGRIGHQTNNHLR